MMPDPQDERRGEETSKGPFLPPGAPARPRRRLPTPEPTMLPPDETGERPPRFGPGTRRAADLPAGPSRLPVLVTLDGRRVAERFVIRHAAIVLGRDPSVDLLVTDGEVSRRHARIDWTNHADASAAPECVLEDMGSTNGTQLNDKPAEGRLALRDGDRIRVGRTVYGFFITDARLLEMDEMLLSMALNDGLTGALKREYFLAELHREFERARRHKRPLALLMIDIDHFKSVNDDLGHVAGDEALRQVANLIRVGLRDGDLCGRYGGEEFSVLLPETTLAGALEAGERIRGEIERYPFRLSGTPRRITASVGAAELDREMATNTDLVARADEALYRAKRAGRNRVEG